MIHIKNAAQIELMSKAGKIAAGALAAAGRAVTPGITTAEIDRIVRDTIRKSGAEPSFLGYNGFPAAACISINNEVIHGIPSKRRIREGDLVKIDVGAFYKGYHGDTASTFTAGVTSPAAVKLAEVTRQSFYEGIRFARAGNRISDISHAIESYVSSFGYSPVHAYIGHGVGAELHESPDVPNFGRPGTGARLVPGMTIAVEPMINAGGYEVKVLPDGWTVVTADGELSAHYEHTLLITGGDPVLLTLHDAGEDANDG